MVQTPWCTGVMVQTLRTDILIETSGYKYQFADILIETSWYIHHGADIRVLTSL